MDQKSQPVSFAGCLTDSVSPRLNLVLLGICDDSQSSYLPGCADAPAIIRSAYDGRCYNSTTETGIDLATSVLDLGDLLPQPDWERSTDCYRSQIREILKAEQIPFLMGGDHAVTIPILEALSILPEPVHVVQIDAHADLYPDWEGNRFSHACVAARALEMDHVATLTCLGVRTLNRVQQREARKHRGRFFEVRAEECAERIPQLQHLGESSPVYLTLDLDALDPAFAPGVSHPVPGGLSPRLVFNFLHRQTWRLVGMDVVEVNPLQDENHRTAILAARLLHEGMGLAKGPERPRRGVLNIGPE